MTRLSLTVLLLTSIASVSILHAQQVNAAVAPFVKNVQAEEADQLLKKDKQVVILDIRTPSEFKGGHLAHAKNIDFYENDFQKQLESLDKKKTYLVHCASGGRSSKARDLMKKLGFEGIYHLDGGFKGWMKAGKPVEK